MNTLRIFSSLASVWAYIAFRSTIRKESERRLIQQRLDDVIRGGK